MDIAVAPLAGARIEISIIDYINSGVGRPSRRGEN